MLDISKLTSIPFVEHKGQKIDKIYEIRGNDEGIIDEIFRRVINVENSVRGNFSIRPYGIDIIGSYPHFEKRMNQGKGGRYSGKIGLLVNGDNIGEEGWKNYFVTFRNTIDSCMNEDEETNPNLVKLLEDLIIGPLN